MICGDVDGPVMMDWARLQGAAVAGSPIPSPATREPFPSVANLTFTVPAVVMVKLRAVPPFTETWLANVMVVGDVVVGDVVVSLLLHAAPASERHSAVANGMNVFMSGVHNPNDKEDIARQRTRVRHSDAVDAAVAAVGGETRIGQLRR